MVDHSLLRHLLSDDDSLKAYYQSKTVDLADIRRHLMLLERSFNRNLPDHHYRLLQKHDFAGISSVSDLFTKGLPLLSQTHLYLDDRVIYVKQDQMNNWQELITGIPPLVLLSSFLQNHTPLLHEPVANLRNFYMKYVLPNTRFTALPGPHIIQLENYLRKESGLHDLHMHLNGATETDVTWQDHLAEPDKIYSELVKGFRFDKVREQFEQESRLLDPAQYYQLIKIARRIRNYLFNYIVLKNTGSRSSAKTISGVLRWVNDSYSADELNSAVHPLALYLGVGQEHKSSLALECMFYILVAQYLQSQPRVIVAGLFHYYLLILGLTNRLLVQQMHQYGFEQFQKHTLNGLREHTEKRYRDRFFQLQGNKLKHLRFLEGRFSPKGSETETLRALGAIYDGWDNLIKHLRWFPTDRKEMPQLKLIAHFIKREDSKPDDFIRYRALRTDVWQRAGVLRLFKANQRDIAKNIVGIDAAASEFDTPPEVFGPVFRMLRKNGYRHFTYHAGEDFHHLLSGLRAVYEATVFCGLERGDRIGHATATALSVDQWLNAMGEKMLITQGEWLDNLTFCYHIIVNSGDAILKDLLPSIMNEIQHFIQQIYGRAYPISVIEQSWLYRRYCPIMLFNDDISTAKQSTVFDPDEWTTTRIVLRTADPLSIELLKLYHLKSRRKKYDQIITIKTQSLITADHIERMQLQILQFMHQQEIVIETLPTSNVRIGHHLNYETYHLWNWARWQAEGKSIPPIIAGTDDTGIFATNILNEYGNIYCYLTGSNRMSHTDALAFIKQINENGKIYRFES